MDQNPAQTAQPLTVTWDRVNRNEWEAVVDGFVVATLHRDWPTRFSTVHGQVRDVDRPHFWTLVWHTTDAGAPFPQNLGALPSQSVSTPGADARAAQKDAARAVQDVLAARRALEIPADFDLDADTLPRPERVAQVAALAAAHAQDTLAGDPSPGRRVRVAVSDANRAAKWAAGEALDPAAPPFRVQDALRSAWRGAVGASAARLLGLPQPRHRSAEEARRRVGVNLSDRAQTVRRQWAANLGHDWDPAYASSAYVADAVMARIRFPHDRATPERSAASAAWEARSTGRPWSDFPALDGLVAPGGAQ